MTLIVILLMYGGTTLITSGIEGVSLACTFQWIINGASGKVSDTCNPSGGTGGNTGTTGPNFALPGSGSVIHINTPFTA